MQNSYVHERAGHGNVSAAEMISMALYGAVAATATCGAMVSIERAAGRRGLRRLPGGHRHEQGVDAGRSVGHHRAVRVNRIPAFYRFRPIRRLSAAVGERHAGHRARADAVQLRRWPVHPAQPVLARFADLCQVHAAVRAEPACPLPADRRHPSMGLELEPGLVARDLRGRRRLEPAPRHCASVIQRRGGSGQIPAAIW